MFSIGHRIKDLMEQKKIDAPELARRIGKTKQAVYAMLEKEDLNTSILRELSLIFNVPVTYFLSDNNDNMSKEKIDSLNNEIRRLKTEIKRLEETKTLHRDDKALNVSMKFFEAAKEMFRYYNQLQKK